MADTLVILDDATIAHASERYLALRDRLPRIAVDEIDKVLATLPIDPRSATASQAWRVIWDKPLFANTKVNSGRRWINELTPFMDDAWMVWGAEPTQFKIIRTGRRRDADSFDVMGAEAQRVRGATRTAVHRLYAIQNAATLLRSMAVQSDIPVARFWTDPLDALVPDLMRQIGWGWGATTVLHMLADFGVASKPDLHVMRSLRHLGIWTSTRDQVTTQEALAVNRAIRKMVLLTGGMSPARMRRLDIELMSLSRHKVIPADQGNDPSASTKFRSITCGRGAR
ncbi:MAG: hypothetical protein JJT81_15740 [Rubellimicrobium sp.]|nr:hypothetical protein [Rubellimicrobium sp.]